MKDARETGIPALTEWPDCELTVENGVIEAYASSTNPGAESAWIKSTVNYRNSIGTQPVEDCHATGEKSRIAFNYPDSALWALSVQPSARVESVQGASHNHRCCTAFARAR